MSQESTDKIASQAENQAIEIVLDKGIDPNHPGFDKLVDIQAKQIFEDLINQPGPHG